MAAPGPLPHCERSSADYDRPSHPLQQRGPGEGRAKIVGIRIVATENWVFRNAGRGSARFRGRSRPGETQSIRNRQTAFLKCLEPARRETSQLDQETWSAIDPRTRYGRLVEK